MLSQRPERTLPHARIGIPERALERGHVRHSAHVTESPRRRRAHFIAFVVRERFGEGRGNFRRPHRRQGPRGHLAHGSVLVDAQPLEEERDAFASALQRPRRGLPNVRILVAAKNPSEQRGVGRLRACLGPPADDVHAQPGFSQLLWILPRDVGISDAVCQLNLSARGLRHRHVARGHRRRCL